MINTHNDNIEQSDDSENVELKGDVVSNAEIIRNNFVVEQDIDFNVILKMKWWSRFLKRTFDICASFFGLVFLTPIFLVIAIIIGTTSEGGVFFLQERVGRDGKVFKIIKFRTMTKNAESSGMQITVGSDMRITNVGRFLRATKIDELPQLLNVFIGQMSIVGARPEVPKYVAMYSDYERNILKIRPGITELSSIVYKDEASELAKVDNAECVYINEIMTKKLEYNIDYIKKFGLFYDIKLIFKTFFAIIKD